MKVDLADGFYRMHLRPEDVPLFGVALPPVCGQQHIAFPLVLPMGWVSSPPYFSAATESVADVTNHRIRSGLRPAPHRLNAYADTSPVPTTTRPSRRHTATYGGTPLPSTPLPPRRPPVGYVDVYVDDFIGVGQGSSRHTFNACAKFYYMHSMKSSVPSTQHTPLRAMNQRR